MKIKFLKPFLGYKEGEIVEISNIVWINNPNREQYWRDIDTSVLIEAGIVEEIISGFMECDTCRAKLGTPNLCRGCFHNRTVINQYERNL